MTMKIEILKTVAIQASSRANTGDSDNTLLKATAIQSSTLYNPLGDNVIFSGGVASGAAGYRDGSGSTQNKQNYTYGIIQNNIKT